MKLSLSRGFLNCDEYIPFKSGTYREGDRQEKDVGKSMFAGVAS
jgi:hypothetical protein